MNKKKTKGNEVFDRVLSLSAIMLRHLQRNCCCIPRFKKKG